MDVEFKLNGTPVRCPKNTVLSAALYMLGERVTRVTERERQPRSVFCGMGICYDCVMRVDGRTNVRSCQVLVTEGMDVQTQTGEADLGGLS